MYADDVVLLAETEQDLQVLLNAWFDWLATNGMNVNKSSIM